jgi:hypothetical protein
MSIHTEIETAQAISRQTVATTLENDCFRAIPFHNTTNDRLEDAFVRDIVNAVSEWEIHSVVFSLADTNVA